ncbi:AGE family epimerase/isomerase [Tellurirhabdus rosea]|uniref:AGE family epimerase/isomerase n=1 Tax=Tellurirhabdus rosea TaxID=2674997 RepID=UPI002254FDEB|nr:AGE family epimerase/isomerase [Tellurirhabdus rosea]
MEFGKWFVLYQEALFRSVIPFWVAHSRDTQSGGYFNALNAAGDPTDTDKSVHLQAQQVWAFAWLYNRVDAQPSWLDLARHGADFLRHHGRTETGRWLAVVDRRGRPVAPSPDVLPDCFAAMAFAQLFAATGEREHAAIAVETMGHLLAHRQRERIRQAEELGGFREFRRLGECMTTLKALLEVRPLLTPDHFKDSVEGVVQELQNEFFDKRLNLLRENVLPEGAFSDTAPGRRLHPGLVFETAGYLLDAAEVTGNRKLVQQALLMAYPLADIGWDNTNGGFFQYADLKERPLLFTEWDRKLLWVHTEALAFFTRAYALTRQNDCLKWIRKVHEYLWDHFPDKNGKEWFGTLDRTGVPVTTCKVTPERGCYHQIKGLYQIWQTMEMIAVPGLRRVV